VKLKWRWPWRKKMEWGIGVAPKNPNTFVVCESCGFEGTMQDFLKRDSEDTFCPKCGSDDEHRYEL